MPPGMPGNVSKGRILRQIDRLLNHDPAGDRSYSQRAKVLAELLAREPNGEYSKTLVQIAGALADPTKENGDKLLFPEELDHLSDHWFTGDRSSDLFKGYWPDRKPMEVVVRLGLAQAINLAQGAEGKSDPEENPPPAGPRVPLDHYWICAGNSFEVVICKAPTQVTVLILTPSLPTSSRVPSQFEDWRDLEDIFTVRHCSQGPGEERHWSKDYVELVQSKAENPPQVGP